MIFCKVEGTGRRTRPVRAMFAVLKLARVPSVSALVSTFLSAQTLPFSYTPTRIIVFSFYTDSPGNFYVDQADLKLMEICSSLGPECWH